MRIRLGTLRRVLRDLVENRTDQADDRMVGDDAGPGGIGVDDIADHLRSDDEKRSLGDAPDETIREHAMLSRELRSFFLQEGPAGAGLSDPREPTGAYAPFDMKRDHTGTDDLSSTWYKSPGQQQGTAGDPYRSEDPLAQLGFHTTKDSTSPPEASGEEGTQARLAPPIWQLSAGSDTSKVLGANAHPDSGSEESDGEPEEDEEGEPGEGDDAGDDEAEGEEPDDSRPQRGQDR